MTDEVLLLKTSFVSLVSKLSLSRKEEMVEILKDLMNRCISLTKPPKMDSDMKPRDVQILEAEYKISATKAKLLALTVFSFVQYDVDSIFTKFSIIEQNLLLNALIEFNELPKFADIDSLQEFDDTKLSALLTVIRWFIKTYYSGICPSLSKINFLAMGRLITPEPNISDAVSEQVEDSIEKCILLYKDIVSSRKTPIKFHVVSVAQALRLINDYIDVNDSNNSSLVNSSVDLATEELSAKSFEMSVDELTIYISHELGWYYFFERNMQLAKEYFDKIFTIKRKIGDALVYDYKFDRLQRIKAIVEMALEQNLEEKPISKDLHQNLQRLFESPTEFPIKEFTLTDNDMQIVLDKFKNYGASISNDENQLNLIGNSLRFCSRFVSFSNKELLEDLLAPYSDNSIASLYDEAVEFPFLPPKKFPVQCPNKIASESSTDAADSTSLEILSNLEITPNDILATFPENFVSEYFSVNAKNVTALNQTILESIAFDDIKCAVDELILYCLNDKAKVFTHLKSLHLICEYYDEFVSAIENLQLASTFHVAYSKCHRLLNKSPTIAKQFVIGLLEALVEFIHSMSSEIEQLTYEKAVTIVEAETLVHSITHSCKPSATLVKETCNLLEQAAKYKNFQLRPSIYVTAFTYLINCEEYQPLVTVGTSSMNTEPVGHLSTVFGAFFLPQPSDGVNPESLKNFFDLFGLFTESSDHPSHLAININTSMYDQWIDAISNVKFINGLLSMLVSVYNFAIIDKTRSNLTHISELAELHFNIKNKNLSTISNVLLLKLIVTTAEKLLQLNFHIDIQLLHSESLYLLGDYNGCLKSFAWATVYFLKDIVGDHDDGSLFESFIDQITAVRIADSFSKTNRPLEAVCILQPFIYTLNGGIVESNVEDIVGQIKASRINSQLLELVYDSDLLSVLSDKFLKGGLSDVYGKLVEQSSAIESNVNNASYLLERIVLAKKVKFLNHIQNTCLFTAFNF